MEKRDAVLEKEGFSVVCLLFLALLYFLCTFMSIYLFLRLSRWKLYLFWVGDRFFFFLPLVSFIMGRKLDMKFNTDYVLVLLLDSVSELLQSLSTVL